MGYRTKFWGPGLAALTAMGALGSGCAEPHSQAEQASSTARVGSLGLALELAPGVVLDTIDYEITGAGFTMTGTLPVAGAGTTFTATIPDVPVGTGHQLHLTSQALGDAGIACVGSAPFDVMSGATTQVNVALLCDSIDETGATTVNGEFNVCPRVTSSTLTPATQSVGATIALSLVSRDLDNSPAPRSFTWSSANGSFANATTATPTFTCLQPGPVQLAYTVSDGSCTKSGTLAAVCTVPVIRINEVESNGGIPGDWVELYNPGSVSVDLSGWAFKDNDESHAFAVIASGAVISAGGYYVIEESAIGYGLGGADSARLFAPDQTTLVDSYSWTAHATSTYGRCPDGAGGLVQTPSSKGVANVCGQPDAGADAGFDAGSDAAVVGPTTVVVNEVESNGGVPGDWVELHNRGSAPVDVSGWAFKDNDESHAFAVIASGTVIPAGGYFILEESAIGFGLGAADSARLYAPNQTTLLDTYSWTAHAASTYGRCPNGTGAFQQTASTKGAVNDCTSAPDGGVDAGTDAGSLGLPWPGTSEVVTVDALGAWPSNLSGLTYQAGPTAASSILWAVQNDPSKLYRLQYDGSVWTSTTSDDWGAGKQVFYPGGVGRPDTEGVTTSPGTSYLYLATERDNALNGVSRLSVLQVDVSAPGTTLTALREWNLTASLPTVGPNLGLEAITFVSDAELSAQSFREGDAQPYNQARFSEHGGGVFLVGVEGTGFIHVYALNHADSSYYKIASFSSGFPGVMGLEYDEDTNYLWAYGDDTVGNRAALFQIEPNMASLSYGQFVLRKVFERPAGLPAVNNEGIAFAPESECAGGSRSFYWADDGATGGHSLRRGNIPCGLTY